MGRYSTWNSTDDEQNSQTLLDEAQSETGWNSNQQGMDVLVIFTDQSMDHRGRSEAINQNGGNAWIMKHQITSGWDWHLAQHEASHNYGIYDHGYNGPVCIITYAYMMVTDDWCSGCGQTIETNRNHF